jgi:hypothetical protein
MVARMPGTGHLERLVFNANGEQRREWLLGELRQRIRDVRQGPDGLIYVLTEEEDGARDLAAFRASASGQQQGAGQG